MSLTLGEAIDKLTADTVAMTINQPFIILNRIGNLGHITFANDNSIVRLTGQMLIHEWEIKKRSDVLFTKDDAIKEMMLGSVMFHQNEYYRFHKGNIEKGSIDIRTGTIDWNYIMDEDDQNYFFSENYYWIKVKD